MTNTPSFASQVSQHTLLQAGVADEDLDHGAPEPRQELIVELVALGFLGMVADLMEEPAPSRQGRASSREPNPHQPFLIGA